MKAIILFLLLANIMLVNSFEARSQGNPKPKPPSWVGNSIGSTTEGVSKELMTEYATLIAKYKTPVKQWWKDFQKNISPKDRNRLEEIFKHMSLAQQAEQKVAFIKPPPPLKKVVPSGKELASWKNPKVYGVWIDGKKVSNAVLDQYENTDFHQVFISKLYGAAKHNRTYSFQLDLMTKNYYQKYYEQSIAKGGSQLVFRG